MNRQSGMEDQLYLTSQVITYLGNKRALLDFIASALQEVQEDLGRERLYIGDLFSGSGIVSRYFKRYSEHLIVNDLERYCEMINLCYLHNRSELDMPRLKRIYDRLCDRLDNGPLEEGIIARYYAPRDANDIQPGERVFYTPRNARYIDTARRLIGQLDEADQPFFLAPLLTEASVHNNTS